MSSFCIVLPSNTKYEGNKTNKYKVHLPKSLKFDSNWVCGLHSIIFPYSWPAVGATEEQYLNIFLKNGQKIRAPFPSGSPSSPEELEMFLNEGIISETKNVLSQRRIQQRKRVRRDTEEDADDDEVTKRQREKIAKLKEEFAKLTEDESEDNSTSAVGEKDVLQASVQTQPTHELSSDKTVENDPTPEKVEENTPTSEKAEKNTPTPEKADENAPKPEKVEENAPNSESVGENVSNTELTPTPQNVPSEGGYSVHSEAAKVSKTDPEFEIVFGKSPLTVDTKATQTVHDNTENDPRFLELQERYEKLTEILSQKTYDLETSEKEKTKLLNEKAQIEEDLTSLIKKEGVYAETDKEIFSRGKDFHFPNELSDSEIESYIAGVTFTYLKHIGKFKVTFNNSEIETVSITPQLNYTLGFENENFIKNDDVGRYGVDMRGGIDQLYVYSNISQDMIVGDSLSALLRIVSVSGKHGDLIEKIYDAPIFNKVNVHEINEIEIEVRTANGRLVPFQFGVIVATLIFKKMLYL